MVLLDLSAAFDTVDLVILLRALGSLGIGGTVIEWYRSHLSGRGQRISVHGCTSERFNLDCGVPQGSCLGPLLFSIYTSSLLSIVQDLLPTVYCYADDNQLYVSFSPADENGQSDAIAAMESCVRVIRNWMHENRLLMNETKTEFLLIGTKQQLAKVNVDHVKVGSADIVLHSPVKNLGVWLDSNLSMVEHITKASSSAFFLLYNIRRIRKFLSRENTETLIHAFVSSRIDYCNSLLYGVPNCHLHKLQRVQNAAAHLIFEESKYCHVTPLLKSLHWLPFKYRIILKVLLITFKAIHGLAPVYISELISIRDVSFSRYCLRLTNSLTLNYPALKSRKTLGDRSFFVAAPKLWNKLPSDIRDLNSINSFKTAIKTYLFRQAFLKGKIGCFFIY